jgi:hypothetical protein
MDIEIFTSKAQLRPAASFTEAERESLSPDRRDRLDRLVAAAAELEQVEADLLAAQKSVERWASTRAAAVAELERLAPRPTFYDTWRAAFK